MPAGDTQAMNTKDRQRQRDAHAPRAGAPGWLIVLVAAIVTALAILARGFV
jgi:hypothetical protein